MPKQIPVVKKRAVRGSKTGRPIMALLDFLGRRWSLRILRELREAPLTARALRAACDEASPTALQARLSELREAGLVELVAASGYRLTGLAWELLENFQPLYRFAERWSGSGADAEWIRSTLQYGAAKVTASRPGSETVLTKFSELLFVEAVRRYAETLPKGQTGWLAGLREPHVARALALLHRDVTRRWTVDGLSREVGLSRSALADRFTHLIGVPPMYYLANWRMQVATQKLRNTSASLAQIADLVGYGSEAAFSRAFKKVFGTAPATWRRSNR
jgi:AraC-like DNA-binding protein/DNA-binding HxlR family transcriptional regulator